MSLRNQVLIWLGFTAVVILAIWVFRPILLPFVLGIAIAYILNPAVNIVQRGGLSRAWATAVVLLALLAVIVGIFVIVTPLIFSQVQGLLEMLPGLVGSIQARLQAFAPQLIEWLGPERTAQLEQSLTGFLGTGVDFILNLTGQLAQSGLTVISTVATILLTPVVAFYALLDWEGMVKGVDDLLPREHRREVRQVLDQINTSMAGVIRGQGGVILVLCIYYAAALTLTGLNFGLVIGLLTGILSFVPFFGFLTGFVLSMGIALVQFAPNWWFVAIVFVVYLIGQFLEGNVLYPRFVGQSININPVWLMFALFAFLFLFGFVGLLLAVPLAAITATLTRYAVGRYKQSALYRGERRPKAPVPEPELALTAAAVPAEAPAPARRSPAASATRSTAKAKQPK